ncbi:MAG: hypothetical protein ACLP1Q_16920 [Solirubrobacteraceae bacterium]|jgi:hypothetical protein
MGDSPETELVRRVWDALIQGGPEVLGEVLAMARERKSSPHEHCGRRASLVQTVAMG